MKVLKKVLIGVGILFFVIFLILLLTPILFKGKIFNIAKTQLNNMLEAKVEFSDLKLSFIRNFPNAYVALEDVSVTGVGDFEDEILAAFKTFSVTVDIMSVIKMDNIQVKSILLDQPQANAHILENGKANWDIMKASEASGEEAVPEETAEAAPVKEATGETAAESSAFNIALNKFEIRNANLSYTDDKSKMKASIDDLDFFLKGDTTIDVSTISLKLDIAGINFWMDGVRLLKDANVGLVSDAAADIKNMAFSVNGTRFNLNEIVLLLNGTVNMPGDDIDVDMTFATEKTDFKNVLSLIPAIYMKDFEKLTTTGSFTIAGDVKGTYNSEQMPNANVKFTVDNAMFKYPDLPKSVDNINIAVRAFYDGAKFDNTTADVDKFHFEMAGNPFDIELHVKTPESDMQVAAKFNGKIDFGSLLDIVPLDDITLSGLLDCDIALAGRLSTIEQGRYEDFDARGSVKLTAVNAAMPSLPQAVQISRTQLDFTPRRVNLANFDMVTGNTDISMNGALENFIPFVFKGSTVRGNLSLKSNMIDLNEFMGGEKSEKPQETEKAPEESSPMSVIEVPNNIDFALNVNIGKLLFDKLEISNTVGAVLVRDGKVQMQRLAMNLLEGSMVLNGAYSTQDIKAPSVDFDMDIRRFDVNSAISSLSMVEKILPQPQNYAGQVSAKLTLKSILDEQMSPVMDTVASKGQLQTHNLQIKNSDMFGKMADLLKNDTWRTPTLNNVNINFEIKEGRLFVEPVLMNIAQARLNLSGSQGLDSTLDYKLNVSVPVSTVGRGATDILGKIPGGSNIRDITVSGLIGGLAAKPDVSLSVADMTSSVVTAVTQQAREQVSAEIQKQRDAVMAEAERQAQTVRNTAKQSADKVRSEANSAADRLIRNAASKTVIERNAAKVAADKLRREGEANATKLEREAESQVNNIMDAARKKAQSIT